MKNANTWYKLSILFLCIALLICIQQRTHYKHEYEDRLYHFESIERMVKCEDLHKKGFCKDVYLNLKLKDALNLDNLGECDCEIVGFTN